MLMFFIACCTYIHALYYCNITSFFFYILSCSTDLLICNKLTFLLNIMYNYAAVSASAVVYSVKTTCCPTQFDLFHLD